ncbi:MAG: hypothetical protein JO182_09370, partial [Acidobacteriaceae bacterium]|nr:hypothetical protein [Acidobacteriaceae bacterium]
MAGFLPQAQEQTHRRQAVEVQVVEPVEPQGLALVQVVEPVVLPARVLPAP